MRKSKEEIRPPSIHGFSMQNGARIRMVFLVQGNYQGDEENEEEEWMELQWAGGRKSQSAGSFFLILWR